MLPHDVEGIVTRYLSFSSQAGTRRRLVAFYGGSFTGIDDDLLDDYLEVVSRMKEQGIIDGMKLSTRPDMIFPDMLNRLSRAGCQEVELGAQSMDDAVLAASRRGHTRAHTIEAAALIHHAGIGLGIQLMPGLPGEDRDSFLATVDAVIALRPQSARIYPTVVIEGTGLAACYRQGSYTPLSLEEAERRTLYAYLRLYKKGCKVLRMGIPFPETLDVIAGPCHPAFGSLVRARGFRIMAQQLVARGGNSTGLRVNPSDASDLLGYRRKTIEELKFSYSFDETLPRGYVGSDGQGERACLHLGDIIEYIL